MDFHDFPMLLGNLGVETDHPPKMSRAGLAREDVNATPAVSLRHCGANSSYKRHTLAARLGKRACTPSAYHEDAEASFNQTLKIIAKICSKSTDWHLCRSGISSKSYGILAQR